MSDLGRLVAGRYRLAERVGRGGMGTVWRAEDELLGRHVAVKKLHVPPHLNDDEIRTLHERTRREARSAARITHAHVVVVHDVVDDEGLPCIVMEYIPSVTLGDVLAEHGALAPAEAARHGLAMAAALRAAHDAGVLHRDVKPANVLLGHDGRTVLTDFGIAVESGTPSLTRTGELIGSVRYLAPERLRSAEHGPACDLWSLGVTLYEAVEGRHPFERGTAMETAYAIATEPHAPPRAAGELAPLIEGLLVKDPERRTPAHEAERLLRRVAGTGSGTGATVLAPAGPAPAAAPARRGGRGTGRRAALWCGSAIVVAGCVTGGVLLWPGDGDEASGARPATGASRPAVPPVPSGYHLARQEGGLALPVRDGWTRKNLPGGDVAYIDPTGLVGLRVNVAEFAGSDPVEHWRRTEESQTRRDNPGYERVRMAATTFRGAPAGYWEFTFDGKARTFRAVEMAFSDDDGTQYVVYLSAPNERWKQYRPVFDTAVKGIRLDG
ncbi:serine/threonine-protein kinase [Streptomyces sp. NPDC047071]|uniref:serine/threonine-protein kinase n=1 Tax=Streptomyces sp. NPDC047071 TaxID=3154808 RepID=UPI003454A40F